MNISAPFIGRPVATTLLAIAIFLLGVLGYRSLPVSSLPQVDFPTIQVVTKLPGASPDTASKLLTAPLERQFGEIAGLSSMSSISSQNTSAITLRFDLSVSLDTAAQNVQAAINAASGTLPPNLQYPPTYTEVNPADAPIVSIALTSTTVPIYTIANAAQTQIVPKLSEISGVGNVSVEGGMTKAIRINVNPARLAAYGLSLEDVRNAISNANQTGAKGAFDGKNQAYTLGANDQITAPAQYRNLIIAYSHDAPVRLSAVGTVTDGLENNQQLGSYNNVPAVVLDIQRQPGANIVSTVQRVQSALGELRKDLPPGIKVQIVANRTGTIKASVNDVQITLITSALLVILVIFLFLPNPRAVLIPAVALPLSIVATFAVMSELGYQLDNLSLMALTVASGFVVDDAIVMIENIVRFIEAGETPMRAAYLGSRQIGFTIVSLTISLVAVFIPLLFMPGVIGRLFSEFAVTLAIAVVISAVISLTLTPMMSARLLRPADQSKPGRVARAAEAGLLALRNRYQTGLDWSLRHRRFMMLLFGATIVITGILFYVIPKALLPQEDTGAIVAVTQGAQSISLDAMNKLQSQAVATILRNKAVAGVTSLLGSGLTNPTPNTGRLNITLTPFGKRPGITTVISQLQSSLAGIPGLNIYMQPVQDITLSSRISPTQYQYTLTDTNQTELDLWARKIQAAMAKLPQLADLASDQQNQGLETYIKVDRAAAARLGISMATIEAVLYDAFGQRQISTIYTQNAQYRVVLGVDPQYASSPQALASIYLPASGLSSSSSTTALGPGGSVSGNSTTTAGSASSTTSSSGTANSNTLANLPAQVPLTQVATIERKFGPLAITREDQFPSVTLSFNLANGSSLGAAESAILGAERKLGIPETISGSFSGAAAEFQTSLAQEPWLILAALVVIYIVLGVLYESTIHPLTILSTLPSAGVGALLALMITGTEFTLVALVGIVLLMGIVKKNGIIMVDFAIEAERNRGLSPEAAIMEAAILRFRPIMMTTLAALFGAVPLVLEGGAGSELRAPLGITIIGGLLLSQLLTLFTTPVIYLAMDRLRPASRLASASETNGPGAPAPAE
ncbi:efflux RND transporter permease subunit [Acidiphilium acidophilum]|uniref:Efflux RND transporter permease subunit n=1 Tax=Acidiphilium acidophilum TaxID=76588 RepID=A0AAW9DRC4_ACIAO|nr:efflux RND transporter permease subunit [Acidiphilium acidophilum]MDX5931084.1 efflux RND transporter permease subunit [Acidiphilium acidophilum]